MTQKRRFGSVAVNAALGLATTAAAFVLLVPNVAATPETDAAEAMMTAWEDAGGDDSELGPPQGDVYPAGEGFAEDFTGGKMYYTPDTGAHALFGAVLDKYDSLGGAAGSDLGFPVVDQGVGLAGPDSRSAVFSANDNPVIYYTPDSGAFVVRGAINAAWDKLGSSTGALGVPVADASTDGEVITQKFSGGAVSWNTADKTFTTDPPELAGELSDAQVPADDATAAINRAWQAAGGAGGPLGDKQGDQYPLGGDGVGQNFAGGKVFFSPPTGANAISGDVLAKYESLGGPAGSDLGLPVTNEADGSIPDSRVATFSGDDTPVIFFTPDHGAFVVRGAMNTAWDKLGGAAGDLGAPVADQTVDGNVVSQKFSAGQIAWDRAANRFTTSPEKLASSLDGLQVPGQTMLSTAGSSHDTGRGFTWHWWWLMVAIAALVALPLLVLAALWWRRGSTGDDGTADRGAEARRREVEAAIAGDAEIDDDEQWPAEVDEPGSRVRVSHFPGRYGEPPGAPGSGDDPFDEPSPDDSWMPLGGTSKGLGAGGLAGLGEAPVAEPSYEPFGEPGDLGGRGFGEPDDTDTDPTGMPAADDLYGGRHAASGAAETDPGLLAGQSAAFRLPLEDPYQMPEGYPVKANVHTGLYYTPDSVFYDAIIAEIWFADEEVAQFNGFVGAD